MADRGGFVQVAHDLVLHEHWVPVSNLVRATDVYTGFSFLSYIGICIFRAIGWFQSKWILSRVWISIQESL
jgi:hypothetical protein